ncbi:YicC/YloC family endoribonuclease, partial [Reichenbachiella sp.]
MTGFGNAEVCTKGTTISVQISSINRKQTEIRVLQPRELLHLEKG